MKRIALLLVLATACSSSSSSAFEPDPDPGTGAGSGSGSGTGEPSQADPFARLAAQPTACSSDRWCWRMPMPNGNDYIKVHATAPDNLWLIGQHGVVLQWNGTDWHAHQPQQTTTAPAMVYGITGRGATDMWILIGTTVQHWDGTAWTIRDTAPRNVGFDSIWQAPSGDVWVTLSNGTVHRTLAGSMVVDEIDTGCNCMLGAIWGTASDDFWMTGLPGNVVHFDGKMFTIAYSGASTVGSFAGTGKNDVWVSGSDGTLLHWDGTAWTPVATSLAGGYLGAAAALAPDDVWWWWAGDTSASSAFVHWDGHTLTTTPLDTTGLGVFIYSAAIVDNRWWLVGGGGAVYTKTGPDKITPIIDPQVTNIQSMWGAANDDMYFATGGEIARWNGKALTIEPTIAASSISGIHGAGGDELFGVGFDESADRTTYIANAYHFDGAAWSKTPITKSAVSEHRYFTQVQAIGPGEAIAVGFAGLAYRYAAGAWTPIATGVTTDLVGVWNPDPDHAWITGTGGTLLRWDRSNPDVATPDPTLTTSDDLGAIHGAAGSVWIAAGEAAVLRGTSAGWTKIAAPVSASTIFAVDDGNVVIASRAQSRIARWNGQAFVTEDSGAAMPTAVLFQPPGGAMLAGGLKVLVQHP